MDKHKQSRLDAIEIIKDRLKKLREHDLTAELTPTSEKELVNNGLTIMRDLVSQTSEADDGIKLIEILANLMEQTAKRRDAAEKATLNLYAAVIQMTKNLLDLSVILDTQADLLDSQAKHLGWSKLPPITGAGGQWLN